MDHVAIMNKKWKLIDKIVSGEKIIESRWYKTKKDPWNKIINGDRIYFKDSGCDVTAVAVVSDVKQFSYVNEEKTNWILKTFGKRIGFVDLDKSITWASGKKYCVLVFLKNARTIKPFGINKKGFGNACAWICVNDVRTLIS